MDIDVDHIRGTKRSHETSKVRPYLFRLRSADLTAKSLQATDGDEDQAGSESEVSRISTT